MPGNDGRKGWVVDMTGWSEKSCIIKFIRFLMKKAGQKLEFFWMDQYMGKKCILKPETVIREENCGEAAEKKSGVQLIPEKTEDASIWDNYLNILSETKETKVTEADGHRLFRRRLSQESKACDLWRRSRIPAYCPSGKNAWLSCDDHG